RRVGAPAVWQTTRQSSPTSAKWLGPQLCAKQDQQASKEFVMKQQKARVGLARHGDDRRRNVFRALDLVRDDVIPKLRSQFMLKPTFLSSKNQLASSHVDAIRGVLDFLM